MTKITKRDLLHGGTSAILVGAVDSWTTRLLAAAMSENLAFESIVFTHDESPAEIGERYLAGLNQKVTAADLSREIFDNLPSSGRQLRFSNRSGEADKALRIQLAKLIRDDFADRRLASVDGWLLSSTEAKLCALTYLTMRAS